MSDDRWPTELRLTAEGRTLSVSFEDGGTVELPAELLRVESPSAEVQGHGPGQKVLVAGKGNVRILSVEPVGSYAVKLIFTDGHATGIYSWRLLDEMGRRRDELMSEYQSRLSAAGQSR